MSRVLAVVLVLAFACACRQPAPPESSGSTPRAAADIVSDGVRTAKASGRVVLIEFGASWCVWCRNFETFVKAPETASIIAKHFVVLNLVVREKEETKALENAGSADLLEQWGGAKSGIPFYVFLDREGAKIATSNAMPDGSNIGFPAVTEEIEAFMSVMTKAAPSMTPKEQKLLYTYLVSAVAKPKA